MNDNGALYRLVLFLSILYLIPGCDFIGDVFKTGVWVGIIIVLAVISVIAFIVKMFKS